MKKHLLPLSAFIVIVIIGGCNHFVEPEPNSDAKYRSEIYLIHKNTSSSKQLTFDNQVIHFSEIIPKSNSILFVETEYGSIYQKLFIVDTVTYQKIYMCDLYSYANLDIVSEYKYKKCQVSSDGKYFYIASGMASTDKIISKDLIRIDLETKDIVNLTSNLSDIRINELSLSSNNESIVFVEENRYQTLSSIVALNLLTKQRKILYSTNKYLCYHPQYLADGESIFWETKKRDTPVISNIMLFKNDSIVVLEDESKNYYDISYPNVSINNDILLSSANENDMYSLYNLDYKTTVKTKIPTSSHPSVSIDKSKWIYFQDNTTINVSDVSGNTIFVTKILPFNYGENMFPKLSMSNNVLIFTNIVKK